MMGNKLYSSFLKKFYISIYIFKCLKIIIQSELYKGNIEFNLAHLRNMLSKKPRKKGQMDELKFTEPGSAFELNTFISLLFFLLCLETTIL